MEVGTKSYIFSCSNLKAKYFQNKTFLESKLGYSHLLLGGVYGRLRSYYRRDRYGGWEIVKPLIYEEINGFQHQPHT
jgi:hypothetical protein